MSLSITAHVLLQKILAGSGNSQQQLGWDVTALTQFNSWLQGTMPAQVNIFTHKMAVSNGSNVFKLNGLGIWKAINLL